MSSETKTKYYGNVYLIEDENRKKKLQELFLRSIRNALNKWTKIIRYSEKDGKMVRDTDYLSPSYNKYVFQLDYDKKIGIVSNGNDIYELVFDYEDYKNNKYPSEFNDVFHLLLDNVFTDSLKKVDTLVPKTQTEIAEDTRNERSEKLNELWGKK